MTGKTFTGAYGVPEVSKRLRLAVRSPPLHYFIFIYKSPTRFKKFQAQYKTCLLCEQNSIHSVILN